MSAPPAPPLLAIGGPTGVGKSAFAIHLARAFRGEIVTADSRQVYRGMDVGTDKPPAYARQGIPHHLIDLADPDEHFTLAAYQRAAYAVIEAIQARGGLPLLVGGTPLYLAAVLDGWRMPEVAPDPRVRAALEARAAAEGPARLHAELAERDPAAAARILPGNARRLVRALEVIYLTGRPFSEQQTKEPPPYRVGRLALGAERAELHRRVDARVDREVADGLVEEAAALHAGGYGWALPSMTGLGYRQFAPYLQGTATLAEAMQQLKWDTHAFVRHQYTWFRRDPRCVWIDTTAGAPLGEVEQRVRRWLAGGDLGESMPGAMPDRLTRKGARPPPGEGQ
jgi:tRNA dimethylallyltransferase